MPKFHTVYVCRECGNSSTKWMGKCPECEAWDSLVEEVEAAKPAPAAAARRASGPTSIRARAGEAGAEAPIPITGVPLQQQPRLTTGLAELDRVLGGGLVSGSVILVGGDPGIGKSTLLTQAAALIAGGDSGRTVLYVSGEESAAQIKIRSARLGAESDRLLLSVETDIEAICAHIEHLHPALAIVDSIQTMSDADIESSAGTVSQVRACAWRLAAAARAHGTPIVLIGHVTKEGNLAGPRVLEHIVDTVLYFEGDRHHAFRLLRTVKNRFGSTDELGIFDMRAEGLVGVENASAVLLAERSTGVAGSAITAAQEGTRSLLVEVQALAARSPLTSPRRSVTGMDANRVNLLLAVLEKRIGLRLAEQDVFVNAVGGVKLTEPAADLAAALAIASSFREQPVDAATVAVGEIGLAGEVRAVSQIERRVKEAARQGFRRAIVPAAGADRIAADASIRIVPVHTVLQALEAALLPPQE